MLQIGVIGSGRIAMPVINFILATSNFRLAAVLVRNPKAIDTVPRALPAPVYFDREYDLIIEAAGPDALRLYGARALALADTWTISGSALVDDDFRQHLWQVGRRTGHRLRVLPGAMAGLDGAAAIAQGSASSLVVINQRQGLGDKPGTVFSGPLRQAAVLYPDEVNASVAAALAGPGINATTVTMIDPGAGGRHELGLTGECDFGSFRVDVVIHPLSVGHIHPVSASLIAALKASTDVIWAG